MMEDLPLVIDQTRHARASTRGTTMLEMRSAVQAARTWEELGELCAGADGPYQMDGLNQAQVEELASLAVCLARTTSVSQPDSLRQADVAAAALLPARSGACRTCGGLAHWYNHGERTCAVCHPHPGASIAAARTAA